ncbi:DUF6090 family protein [Namhaeicola litoreus]|uniref:DUF6090 family protein n=1 Tax=Namhaeicola litoreus TaxID=1052145 RepID=A0ABW3Y2A6_9FLAO
MISIFRKLRKSLLSEGKTLRYVKYAVGEIVLVMIGILLALQVNIWNETRKAQIAQKELLSNFLEDLNADSAEFVEYLDELAQIIGVHEKLYGVRKGILSSTVIEKPQLLRGSIRYSSIVLTNNPDFAALIKDKELRKEILDYFRLLFRLDNSYLQYDKVVKEVVRPYLAENLSLNEDFLFDNPNEEKSPLMMDHFYEVIKRDDFGQVLFETNLKARELVTVFENTLKANAQLQESIRKKIL